MKQIVLAAILRLADGAPVPQADAIATAIVERAAAEGLDPLLLTSLAWHESRFVVGAKNPKTKCSGLFQLAPFWLRPGRLPFVVPVDGGSRVLLEVAQGARVLRYYHDRWHSLVDTTVSDWDTIVGYFNSNVAIASSWSRKVTKTWRKLQREARGAS